jgi:hypothetical protein
MTRTVRLLTFRNQRTKDDRARSPHGNRLSTFVAKLRPVMKEHLGRCAEHLRVAVRHLASSSSTPQEKLTNMYEDTRFGSISEDDFLAGSLKDDYLTIRASLTTATEPEAVVNIAAMSDDQAQKVIRQICWLSESVAYALGRQSSSAQA